MTELNIVGTFPNPFRGSNQAQLTKEQLQKKVDAINKGRWAPDSDDLDSVVRRGKTTAASEVGDIFGFLAPILADKRGGIREKGTIQRLNVFTHGESRFIGLKGSVIQPKGSKSFTIEFDKNPLAFISDDSLTQLQSTPSFSVGGVKGSFKIDDLRKPFSKSAEMVFYACESGVERPGGPPAQDFLKRIAGLFGVGVRGSRGLIKYCFDRVDAGERLVLFKVGIDTCEGSVVNFHDLDRQTDRFVRVDRPGPH
jgi:hypothetical protein